MTGFAARCKMAVMEESWLTVEELLALAAAEGFQTPEITARKIERWRKEHLLPGPRRIALGRPRGTRSEYPPGTGQQLLALCRLRRRFPHDLDAIRFGLWLERYPLPLDDVKRSVEQLLQPLMRTLPLNATDPLAAVERLLSQKQAAPRRSRSRYRLKQLSNPSDVEAVQIAMLQLALGDVPSFTAHAEEALGERSLTDLFVEMLGLDRAQTDRVGDVKPWLPTDNGELARQLEDMAQKQVLSLSVLLQTLKNASAKQLAQARADFKRMLGFKQAAKVLETMLGPNAFGFGIFREFPQDPAFHAWLLLFLLHAKTTALHVGVDEVGASLRNTLPDYQRMLRFLRVLRHEQPAIARELLAQTRALDLSDPSAFHQLHDIFAAAYASHPEELRAFFQSHPELVPPEGSLFHG